MGMPKKIVILLSIMILFVSSIPIIKAQAPNVPLPSTWVTMKATRGDVSYFDMSLSGVPSGFDISNGTYHGWCIQRSASMALNVNHTVHLYSSYDPNLPSNLTNQNWPKINYVINHDSQVDWQSIQNVIWYFMCNCTYPVNDTDATTMIAEANEQGDIFIPVMGQKIAIIVDVASADYENQRTFLELTLPSAGPVGGLVWNDINANGIHDQGEPGLQKILVILCTPNGSQVSSNLTNTTGRYSFGIFPAGEYHIKFTLPSGYRFSPEHQGTDGNKDSDVNPQTGQTVDAMFDSNIFSNQSDAGMYRVNSQGNPDSPSTSENHPPTSDGTAGEPYQGVVGQEILFNGSRSYDSDGTIVSQLWNFGDGITGNSAVVSHTYSEIGTYNASLTVTDNDGAYDTYHTKVHVWNYNQPPLRPSFYGPKEGNRNISYAFNVTTTDPNNINVQYVINWGDGSQNISLFVSSGQQMQIPHQWRLLGFYTIQVYAINSENLTSEEVVVPMAIDVQYVGSFGYLINPDGVGPFDLFYDNQTQTTTATQLNENGEYLFNINGQANTYNAITGSLNSYQKPQSALDPQSPMLIIGIVIAVILLVLLAIIGNRFRRKSQ
jgi:hypothetical protein